MLQTMLAPTPRRGPSPTPRCSFPKRELLASPLLERMARQHYARDYAGVGSGDTAGELFQTGSGRVAR
jgi:hypothetical protein